MPFAPDLRRHWNIRRDSGAQKGGLWRDTRYKMQDTSKQRTDIEHSNGILFAIKESMEVRHQNHPLLDFPTIAAEPPEGGYSSSLVVEQSSGRVVGRWSID